MYNQLVEILAKSCHAVFQEMAKTNVEITTVKKDERLMTEFAVATQIAYEDFAQKINGQFILGFNKLESAVVVASAIAENMGLGVVEQLDEDAESVLSEFINTIVGHTISTWDKLGLPVRFGSPTLLKDLVIKPHECPQAEAYVVILTLAVGYVTFHVTFTQALVEKKMKAKQRVLVVDDSKIIRQIIGTKLQEAGFEVELANNGLEAAKIYQQFQPALTIMDLVMPEQGGLDAIFDIRQTNPMAKFIILTSTARKDELVTANTLGVSKYLTKPLNFPELLAELEKALENDDAEQVAEKVVSSFAK